MPKIEERPDVSLDELKGILFHHADRELKAYVRMKEKGCTKAVYENQRLRYIAIWSVIEDANLVDDYRIYKK